MASKTPRGLDRRRAAGPDIEETGSEMLQSWSFSGFLASGVRKLEELPTRFQPLAKTMLAPQRRLVYGLSALLQFLLEYAA